MLKNLQKFKKKIKKSRGKQKQGLIDLVKKLKCFDRWNVKPN